MASCTTIDELSYSRHTLLERTRSTEIAAHICEAGEYISRAIDEAEVIGLLRDVTQWLGADAAVFISFIREDSTLATFRCLLACDALWGSEYATQNWYDDDPWMLHAMNCSDPVLASELVLTTQRQHEFVQSAAQFGFRSTVVVPAPSLAGPSRVGMLCIGSRSADYFECAGYTTAKVMTRTIAMEVHEWLHRQLRRDLLTSARITEQDLDLLRHEHAGHCSKVIALELHTDPGTINCRFARLNSRLGASNRRDALRLAKLYGLI